MRIALALVASVVAAPAFADDGAPAPTASVPAAEEPPAQPPAETPPAQPPAETPAEEPSNDMLVPTPRRRVADIVVTSRPDRPRTTVIGLAAGAGVGVILGGIGLYYHLDSRDASNQLNSHRATGEVWSADKQDAYDRAHSSATRAGVFYGVGGAVLIGTLVALILTEPKEETTIIRPHTALVAPTQGGAVVGGMWSF
ncbi:MAG: hypothetical protein HOV81_20645 [Kofleriaceae bacterium]|nr:hypothetical protein [Kofleriaceae bacterium]